MRNSLFTLTFLAACAWTLPAQTKVSGIGKCEKPDLQQMAPIADKADHALVLVHQKCTWTTPMEMEGTKSTRYEVTVMSDSAGAKSQDRGYVLILMENGDKAFVRLQGASISKDGKPVSDEGTWSYTGGTGKLKGITGKGTYKGVMAGEFFEDHVEGEYTMAPTVKSKK